MIIWFLVGLDSHFGSTGIIKLSNFCSRNVENETKYIHFLTLVTQFLGRPIPGTYFDIIFSVVKKNSEVDGTKDG